MCFTVFGHVEFKSDNQNVKIKKRHFEKITLIANPLLTLTIQPHQKSFFFNSYLFTIASTFAKKNNFFQNWRVFQHVQVQENLLSDT